MGSALHTGAKHTDKSQKLSHTQASNTSIPDRQGKPIELLEEYTHKLSQPAEDYIKNLRKHLAIIENIWL